MRVTTELHKKGGMLTILLTETGVPVLSELSFLYSLQVFGMLCVMYLNRIISLSMFFIYMQSSNKVDEPRFRFPSSRQDHSQLKKVCANVSRHVKGFYIGTRNINNVQ